MLRVVALFCVDRATGKSTIIMYMYCVSVAISQFTSNFSGKFVLLLLVIRRCDVIHYYGFGRCLRQARREQY